MLRSLSDRYWRYTSGTADHRPSVFGSSISDLTDAFVQCRRSDCHPYSFHGHAGLGHAPNNGALLAHLPGVCSAEWESIENRGITLRLSANQRIGSRVHRRTFSGMLETTMVSDSLEEPPCFHHPFLVRGGRAILHGDRQNRAKYRFKVLAYWQPNGLTAPLNSL